MTSAQVYRTRFVLRLAVSAAAVFWAIIVAFLAQFPEVTVQTFLTAAAFLAFFVIFTAHYDKLAIVVTPDGLVFTWWWRQLPVRYEEIVKVEVYPSVTGTIYDVTTKKGPIQFSSFFSHHRELFSLLLDRTGLAARR
jgi:hypothetical protein